MEYIKLSMRMRDITLGTRERPRGRRIAVEAVARRPGTRGAECPAIRAGRRRIARPPAAGRARRVGLRQHGGLGPRHPPLE